MALSYALSAFAAYAILNTRPDLATQAGRHLVAGALAIVSLSGVEILIALFPLRRGEVWAFWAALLPLVSLAVPVMLVDVKHVSSGHLLVTLAPFVAGLVLAICGLVLTRRRPDP
ncbi:MAG TPA: hypothetical protein VJN89_16735 [Candidatus Acidoferrum sp.]|nr:hypothetical protein [Candidatus Acidoferrum sp.]